MVFCTKCGKENPKEAEFCFNCGTEIINPIQSTSERMNNDNLNNKDEYKSLGNEWLIIGAAFPIIGVIAGLYYAFKGRKGAWALVIISVIFWVIWAIIFSII
jgi:uncharacterized membrane protein YvbJ